MTDPHEHFIQQFERWEQLGRGTLPSIDYPVLLEPPFTPFTGYCRPTPKNVDDGRRPTLLGQMLGGFYPKSPTSSPSDDEEDDDLEFDHCDSDTCIEISVSLPQDYAPPVESSEALLRQLSECTDPLALELFGTSSGVHLQFAASNEDADFLLGALQSYFPGALFQRRSGTLETAFRALSPAAAGLIECGLGREFMFPLATKKADVFVGLVGALSTLGPGEFGAFQVVFQPCRHPWGESIIATSTRTSGGTFPWIDPTLADAATDKATRPLFSTALQLLGAGATVEDSWKTIRQIAAPLHLLANLEGNYFVPLIRGCEQSIDEEISDFLKRKRYRPGMLLTSDELLGLVHIPGRDVQSPRFLRQLTHTKAAPQAVFGNDGLFLGENEHLDVIQPVRLTDAQRLRHMHLIGSSGTGKSTLLLNLILDDIRAGVGVAVLDPHGDLIDGVLAEIPDDRLDDVVVLDPSDEEASVAFNILAAKTDAERIMLASDLVSVFERLSTSWGDQMNIVLRNAILAFLESSQGGTLADLRRFLIDVTFRNTFLQTITDPDIRYYWEVTFPQFGTKQSVGAIVTRLETFLAPKPVRYIVSQNESTLDFPDIMDSGKILLCRLSQGLIGKENAYLFGSLLVSKLQQTAMSRQRMETKDRCPFWCYIDEFQNFITESMAEILTEARKYRLGLILAHQNLAQIQKHRDVASAVLANTNIRVVFRVGDQDAKVLATGFSGFEASDLQRLECGHAVVRVERSDHDFTIHVPLKEKPGEAEARERREQVIKESRKKYATPRSLIEATLRQKHEIQSDPSDPEVENLVSPGEKPPEEAATSIPDGSKPEPNLQPSDNPPLERGKGGAEHKKIQRQIFEAAEQAGYIATIERDIGGGKCIDVTAENDERSIAIEISITTSIEHEVANVKKCLAADFEPVFLICPNLRKRKRLKAALVKALPDSVSHIHCIGPSEFEASLAQLSPQVSDSPSPPLPTHRGFSVKRRIDRADQDRSAIELSRIAAILLPQK